MRHPPIRPFALSLLAALALSVASARADSEPGSFDRLCKSLFETADFSHLPKNHRFKLLADADFTKSSLLDDLSVKDQGTYGCCWISATNARFQRLVHAKFGREIPLSDDYLVLVSLFIRIEESVHFGNEIAAGGWTATGDWLATHVGLVPETAWKPKIALRDSAKEGKKLVEYLNQEIAAFQTQVTALRSAGEDPDVAWKLAKATKSRLYRHLREKIGNPPSSFEVDGKRYTPNSFAREILPDAHRQVVFEVAPIEPRLGKLERVADPADELPKPTPRLALFTHYPELAQRQMKTAAKRDPNFPDQVEPQKYKLYVRSHGEGYRTTKAPLAEIHFAIGKRLEAGETIYIATTMVRKFYDSTTGLMSIAGSGHVASDAKTATYSGNHAMLITGVYRSKTGELLGYRVQNSWGTKYGQIGYFYMDKDYFDAFASRVTFTITAAPTATK